MSERHLTLLQINDLHGYIEPHPEVFRGPGKFNYQTCGGLARIASIFKRVPNTSGSMIRPRRFGIEIAARQQAEDAGRSGPKKYVIERLVD